MRRPRTMCASCARCCRRRSPSRFSISSRPTSSRRSSISDCRRRSTCAPSATTAKPICASPRSCAGASRQFPASSTRISSRRSTRRLSSPTIDRARAAYLGLNASTIASNINVSLSSSEQVTPNFWTDPASGIPYYFAVQTPEHQVGSLNDLGNTPVSTSLGSTDGASTPVPGLLGNVATFKRGSVPTNANQTNIQPVYEVFASVQGRDLGSVSAQIDKIVADLQRQLTPGNNDPGHRADREHERRLPQSRDRPAVRGGVRLSADGGELPELRRSVRGDPGAARDVLRHPDDAVHHRHHAERPLADGRDHGGRRRVGELHPAGHVRARAAARRQDRVRGGDRRPGTRASGRC